MTTGSNTKTNYYAFGMPMPGRSYQSSSSYRYGFNGKENDLESGTIDFGDRDYYPRTGRWNKPDRLAKLQPGQSPYKAFLNNPILYQDPDGRTEFESITINDQRTGKSSTLTRAISTDVFKSSTRIKYDAFDMPVDEVTWSDKTHHITYTIDKKGNVQVSKKDEFGDARTTSTGPFKNSQTYANIKVSSTSWDESIEGNGESQAGGFVFTSADGGASPTKTKSLSGAEQRDIGDLLTALGALGGGEAGMLGKASMGSDFADKIKDLSQILQDAKEVKENYEKNNSTKDKYCKDCNRTFDKKGKVVENDNHTEKDTIDLNGHE